MGQPFCVFRVQFLTSDQIFQIMIFKISLRTQSYQNSTFAAREACIFLKVVWQSY